jgi:hypothetical protein
MWWLLHHNPLRQIFRTTNAALPVVCYRARSVLDPRLPLPLPLRRSGLLKPCSA